MKYMITGASGALAQYFLKDERFKNNVAFTHKELDITDKDAILRAIDEHKPNVIINCAALSNPFICEENPGQAIEVNCLGPTLLSQATKDNGIKLVHFSSASIYNGNTEGLYPEKIIPSSKYAYASSKSMGETGIKIEGHKNYLIIRVSWIFSLTSKSFVSRLPKLVLDNKELFVNNEQISKLTYAKDIVEATYSLIKKDACGTCHFANSGETTRYEVAEFVKKHYNKEETEIFPVTSAYFNEEIEQPKRNSLSTDVYEKVIGPIRTWQEAYKEYLDEISQLEQKV